MARAIKIDFVSDISCPWCVIGLRGLELALERTRGLVEADIRFHPFELNPMMPAEGEKLSDHIVRKYGGTPEQAAATRTMIGERAAEIGFAINHDDDSRIYNSFDAHRLLCWAEDEGGGRQRALGHGLFEAYFTEQRDISDASVLIEVAERAGLDGAAAREVLVSGRYAEEVRQAEHLWQSRGIHAVPAIIINDRYLISGGQPPDAFEQALRGIAAELADA